MLIDDRRSGVALPELPLLAVLPGTGGLTRLTDKRMVRRDRADVFCSTEEGVRGRRAVEWRLVDEVVPPSAWEAKLRERALAIAARSDRPADAKGIALTPLQREFSDDGVTYPHVRVAFDRAARRATITVRGPDATLPGDLAGIHAAGRCVLAARRGARTGRCDAASAAERADAGADRVAVGRRSGRGAARG